LLDLTVALRSLLVVVGIVVAAPAWALTLAEAIERARQSDPTYLSAQAGLTASQERSSQALGALLPQVTASGNTTANRRNYETRDNPFIQPADDKYNSKGYQAQLTQPLWRRANWIALIQSNAAVSQADAQLAAAEQELLVRLSQAWFDVMLARDVVVFAGGQTAAARHQWEQTRHAVELGLAAAPQLEEARFKYDQAVADEVVAETDQNIKSAVLEQIIGPLPTLKPPALSDDYVLADPRSGTLEEWLNLAETTSPSIQAAHRAYEAASSEVSKQRAGHEPTLDMVATYSKNGQGAGSFPGQNGYDIKQRSVALQLNIPLFSGGTQNAKVGEAIALREKARQDLELARRNVRLAAKQAWFGWQAGAARKAASTQSVKFTSLALKAALTGRMNEVKSELDVLQARQQLYSALRDLQKARYDMITNHIKLKATAGRLVDTDLTIFDAWFIHDGADPAQHRVAQKSPAAPVR
jgi:outer membrane protein